MNKIYILARYELRVSGHGQSDPEIAEIHPFYFTSREKAEAKRPDTDWSIIEFKPNE